MAMTDTAPKSTIERLKRNVIYWHRFYRQNIERFHESRNYVFKSNLTEQQRIAFTNIQRPPFEFNSIESYLSRLIGEYSKQEPSISVHPMPDAPHIDPMIPKIAEGHILAKFEEVRKSGQQTQVYKDQLSGGWSCYKVYTDYANEYTNNQDIFVKRVGDPTMVGFDPLARELSKCDGEFCFEIFPMELSEFHDKYPDVDTSRGSHSNIADFTWSYTDGREKYILLCDYYEKSYKNKKLVYLANNQSMLKEDYNKLLKQHEEMGRLDVPPQIVKERTTRLCTIKRYVFIQNEILSEEDTIYTYLPYVFVDGNSYRLRGGSNSTNEFEYTRPIFYQARNMQDLKNIAGQSLANELENISAARYIAPLEGIPEQYQDPYINIQKPATLIYRAYMEDGITPIPAPAPVARQQIPPEILQTFTMADQGIENILGAINPNLGINQNELSGIALIEAITQANGSSMPYIINNLVSLNQVGQIILDLMPKIYTTPRSIPIINNKRKKTFAGINGFGNNGQDGVPSVNMQNIPPKSLQMSVDAGVNFETQKNRSIQYLAMLSQQFPSLAQLVNSQGLTVLLDNLDFRGADQLKEIAEVMQQKAAQAQAQTPPQPQIDPATLKMMDLQMRQQQAQQQAQTDMAKAQMSAQVNMAKVQTQHQKNVMNFIADQQDNQVQLQKSQTERDVHAAKLHVEHQQMHHKHGVDAHKIAADIADRLQPPEENEPSLEENE